MPLERPEGTPSHDRKATAPSQRTPASEQGGDAPIPFRKVLQRERAELHRRRKSAVVIQPEQADKKIPKNVVGLALSGGGIRSATVSLGILQALRTKGLLRAFDYISTVSGGGYVGGWWSAWLSRESEVKLDIADPALITTLREEEAAARGCRLRWKPVPKVLCCRGVMGRTEFEQLKGLSTNAAYLTALDQLRVRSRMRFKRIFPRPEQIEPTREPKLKSGQPLELEGSRHAAKDPIHHLRLFANYLTPRKGLLSPDTWRAIAVVTRNLLLTWLILLPMAFATAFAGQLLFLPSDRSTEYIQHGLFHTPAPAGTTQPATKPASPALESTGLTPFDSELAHARRRYVIGILSIFGAWLVGLTVVWLLVSGSSYRWLDLAASATGTAATVLLLYYLSDLYRPIFTGEKNTPKTYFAIFRSLTPYLAGGAGLLWMVIRVFRGRGTENREIAWRREVWRGRLVNYQAGVFRLMAMAAMVLLIAGFGYDAIVFLSRCIGSGVTQFVAKSGGTALAILTFCGAIFTAIQASPLGGGDQRQAKPPSMMSKFVFAITPPLVLLLILLATNWLAIHALRRFMVDDADHIYRFRLLTSAVLSGVALCITYAVYEMNWQDTCPYRKRLAAVFAVAVTVGWTGLAVIQHAGRPTADDWPVFAPALLGLAAVGLIIGKADVFGERGRKFEAARRAARGLTKDPRFLKAIPLATGTIAGGILAGGMIQLVIQAIVSHTTAISPVRTLLLSVYLATLTLAVALFAFVYYWEQPSIAARPKRLLLAVAGGIVPLLLITCAGGFQMSPPHIVGYAAIGCIAICLAWVIALGWTADPNEMSMHAFYRGRLVRAYLGASNSAREAQAAEHDITDAIEEDDVLLKDLTNVERGAPYHLINTTLNLVGGRDLATAQRSSACFVMSKLFCGSTRTLYRSTERYMGGRMTLGTAVAISGAAASPNMGSKTPSAAMAMLMTLFNVRLGYWAATPHLSRWREGATRLWPFYTLREFVSSTNEKAPYCYLTDGGHFDNTAVYSLIERGCRFILAADCGADPRPCFQDMGDLIRRCRIDFGAEIELAIDGFIRDPKSDFATNHVVTGTITYSDAHLDRLGYAQADYATARHGVIVWFKPTITGADETADVRQYAMENATFPQQTTNDQWFDEAQFESYRNLAERSMLNTVGKLAAVNAIAALGDKPLALAQIEAVFSEASSAMAAKPKPPHEYCRRPADDGSCKNTKADESVK